LRILAIEGVSISSSSERRKVIHAQRGMDCETLFAR
jgi:hypothetical protein